MKPSIILLLFLMLINFPGQLSIADHVTEYTQIHSPTNPSNSSDQQKLTAIFSYVEEEFLAFNGSGYIELVVDLNKSATTTLGKNWTNYVVEERLIFGVEFNLVNRSAEFQRGDFVFVYFADETMTINPNASYYMDNDSYIDIVPRPSEEISSRDVFPLTFGFVFDTVNLTHNQTRDDNPYLLKYVVFYTGSSFMNISAQTYITLGPREVYELTTSVSNNNSVTFAWAWFFVLMALSLRKLRNKKQSL